MAIFTPHQSQESIRNAQGGRAASCRSESAFVTPGQAAMPNALNRLAGGLDKVNKAVFEAGLEKQRMRNNTAMLADQVALNDAYRAFDSDYRENNKGETLLRREFDYEERRPTGNRRAPITAASRLNWKRRALWSRMSGYGQYTSGNRGCYEPACS
jgi:hypothetical protein